MPGFKFMMLGYAGITTVVGFAYGKALARGKPTPAAPSTVTNKEEAIAAANEASELKKKLFQAQKDRDALTAEVASVTEDLAAARTSAEAAESVAQTTRVQLEAERKASKAKIAALEAELKKFQAELTSQTEKRKSIMGRLF